MPTPSGDLQRDFALLREELQRVTERLELVEACLDLSKEPRNGSPKELPSEEFPKEVELEVKREVTEGRSRSLLEEHKEGHVHFPESAWSFPLVLGLVDAGPMDVAFAILLLLINLGMQVAFSLVILDDDFMGQPFETQLSYARRWRTSVAHDSSYLDLAETSLVSRVCSVDGALILSTTQATLVSQINSFLGMRMDQFDPGFFQPGSLLCMLCILLWALCVYKEYRSIWLALEALRSIPWTLGATDFRNHQFYKISKGRLKALLFTYVVRTVIASVLLGAGVWWLAQTTSITELMLNAVALNAILDVDEFLFAAFTPMSIQLAVQNLQPIKMTYSRRRSQLESGWMFLMLSAILLVPYFALVQPLTLKMAEVKWALCGGNQTFVVQRNTDTQIVVGLRTNPATDQRSGPLSVVETAVQRHSFKSPEEDQPYLVYFRSNSKIFNTFLDRSMETETAAWAFCIESSALEPTGVYWKDPLVTPLADVLLRTAAAAFGRFVEPGSEQSCAALSDLCDEPEARLLRHVCGLTCGCSNPLASPWHKVPAQGCSGLCTEIAIQSQRPCVDIVTGDGSETDEMWQFFWDSHPDMMTAFYGSNVSTSSIFPVIQRNNLAMKAAGCQGLLRPELQRDIGTWRFWCEGNENLWRPLAWICPESCGCVNVTPVPSWCPSTC